MTSANTSTKKSSADIDILDLAGTKAKGQRPYFLADKQVEQVLSIAMAVATELAVTRERLASLEAVLAEKGIISADAIEQFTPTAKHTAARSLDTQEYLARILRIVQQDKEEVSQDDKSMEQLQRELTQTD
ncbi:hypothetical protein [Rheinheimera salexigens]|uniref:Uncharacterized protein n=1 Tax=Rheinheimera salexigens TaxID=1628148 RepID=A0A1E7Q7J2_9GAMM|nr:hypothetical protein [Rheinheimera salexigens]OEY70162.1 hypothetical protein BI198_11750 [Rheinheimera salexigens]